MIQAIEGMEFFSGLDNRILQKVAASAIICQYGKDEFIVNEGETGLGLYLMVRGRVLVTRNQDGRPVPLAEFGPKQFFGEVSIIDDKPRAASIATTEETECVLLTRETFLKLM